MSTVTEVQSRSPFVKAWEKAEPIKGFLSRREAQLLFGMAMKLPPDANILEVGSYRGKSAALLAATGRNVICIDPLVPGSGKANGMNITEDDADSLRALCEEFPNMQWFRKSAKSMELGMISDIDFLYIDGDHQGNAPWDDFMHFLPALKPTAIVAFHDYQAEAGVNNAVCNLEKSGRLYQKDLVGTMYIGRLLPGEKSRSQMSAFLSMPYSGAIEAETLECAKRSSTGELIGNVFVWKNQKSVLTSNFNDCAITFLMSKSRDYWLLLHSDIAVSDGFLDVMVRELETHHLDVLHANIPFKNNSGLTSTAVAYSNERWGIERRITTTEIQNLPPTFDINTLREVYDPDAKVLLPNTGVLLIKRAKWLESFPGFQNLDRIRRIDESTWASEFIPEDWNFGYWCAENGVKVGCTHSVVAKHMGKQWFPSDAAWGEPVDTEWLRLRESA